VCVTLTTSWQRFSVTRTAASTASTGYIQVGGGGSWTAAKGEIDHWGAQFEFGSTPSDYCSTTAAAQILQIADPFFLQAPSTVPGYQWNLNSLCSKRGRQIVVTSSSNPFLYQTVPVNPGGAGNSRSKGITFTSSVWLKRQDGSPPQVDIAVSDLTYEGLSTPIILSASWLRYSVAHTFSAGNPIATPSILFQFSGTIGTFYMFGAQLETEAVASGYKKTDAYSGFHPKCYFASDEFDHQQTEFNVGNIEQLTIIESN